MRQAAAVLLERYALRRTLMPLFKALGSETSPIWVEHARAVAAAGPAAQRSVERAISNQDIEPERLALVVALLGERDPALGAPAPGDATGVYIDIHSYSELVLWPWGFPGEAPNGPQLQTLGRKLAYWNDHSPEQSIGLYPTDGTTDGVSYGELGVASFTYELGTAFFESCSYFEDTIVPDNMPSLIYAAKVARTPYLTPAGPEVTGAAASATATAWPSAATATAPSWPPTSWRTAICSRRESPGRERTTGP